MTRLTAARRKALEYARDDVVLLVKKRGTIGSMDTRGDVRLSSVAWLLERGLLKLDIGHGDDTANGYRLTDKGAEALKENDPTEGTN